MNSCHNYTCPAALCHMPGTPRMKILSVMFNALLSLCHPASPCRTAGIHESMTQLPEHNSGRCSRLILDDAIAAVYRRLLLCMGLLPRTGRETPYLCAARGNSNTTTTIATCMTISEKLDQLEGHQAWHQALLHDRIDKCDTLRSQSCTWQKYKWLLSLPRSAGPDTTDLPCVCLPSW